MKSSNKKTTHKAKELEQAMVAGAFVKPVQQVELPVEKSQISAREGSKLKNFADLDNSTDVVADSELTDSIDIQVAHMVISEPESLDIELLQNKEKDDKGAALEKDAGGNWWWAGLGLLGVAAAAGGGGGGGSSPSDSSAPTVVTFSPTDGATAVGVGSNIVITFNEAIQRGTGNIVIKDADNNVVATYDAATSGNISISGSTLTINPSADLDSTTHYFVTFAAGTIKDLAGNSYAGSATYDFTTADADTPTVVDFTPEDEAGSVAVNSDIVVEFSESIELGDSGTIQIRRGSSSGDLVEEFDVGNLPAGLSISGDTLTISPTSEFDYDTTYFVVFSAGSVTDTSGNAYEGTAQYDFRTDAPPSIQFRHEDFNREYLGGSSHNGGRGIRLDDRLEIDTTDKAVVEVNLVSSEHINDSLDDGADYENVLVDQYYNDVPYSTRLQQVIGFDDVENMETFRLNVSEGDRVRISLELRDLDSDEDFERVEVNVDASSELYAFDDVVRTHNFGTEVDLVVDGNSLVSADYHVVHVSSEAVVSVEADSSSEIFGHENIVVANENGVNGGGDGIRIAVDSLNDSTVHVSQSDSSDSIDSYASIDAELVLVNGLSADVSVRASSNSRVSVDGEMTQNLDDGDHLDGHVYVVDVNQELGRFRPPVPEASADYMNVDVSVSAHDASEVWAWVTADISEYANFYSYDENLSDLDGLSLNAAIVSVDTYAGSVDGGSVVVSLDAGSGSTIAALNDISVDVYAAGIDSSDSDTDTAITNIEAYASGTGVFFGDVRGSIDAIELDVFADASSTVSAENSLAIDIDTDEFTTLDSYDGDDIAVSAISLDANVARLWVGYSSDLDIGSIDMLVVASDSSEVIAENNITITADQTGVNTLNGSSEVTLDNVQAHSTVVDVDFSDDAEVSVDQVDIAVIGEDSYISASNSVDINLYTDNGVISVTDMSLDAAVVNLHQEILAGNVGEINIALGASVDGGGSGHFDTEFSAANTMAIDLSQGYGVDGSQDLVLSNVDMTADVIRVDLDSESDSSLDVNELNINLQRSDALIVAGNVLNAGDGNIGLFGSMDGDRQIYIADHDANLDANLSTSIVSVSVDAQSVHISSDTSGMYCADVNLTYAVNAIEVDLVSNVESCTDANVLVDFDASTAVINLDNGSLIYSEDSTLLSENTVMYGQSFGWTVAVNDISVDIDSSIADGAGFDVTVDADAALIDVVGANPQVDAYFALGSATVGNEVDIYADSDVYGYGYDSLDTVDLGLVASLISVDALGVGGVADAHLVALEATVVTSNDVDLELYSNTYLETDLNIASHLISLDANDAETVAAGIVSKYTDGNYGPFSGTGVAGLTQVNSTLNGPWVDSDININQHGIEISAESADYIDMTHDYSMDTDQGGLLAHDAGSIGLDTLVDSEISAGNAYSDINVESTLVELSVDANGVSLGISAIDSSEIFNNVTVAESIDAEYASAYIDVEAALVNIDAEYNHNLNVSLSADDSSDITSTIAVDGSYDALGNVDVHLRVENIGISIEANDANVASDTVVNVDADHYSLIALNTDINLDINSVYDFADLSYDLETALLSLDVDDVEGRLFVSIEADNSSDISVLSSFDAVVSANDSADIRLDNEVMLISMDLDDNSSGASVEVTVSADEWSSVQVLNNTDIDIYSGEDVEFDLYAQTSLISSEAEEVHLDLELNVDDESDITVSSDNHTLIRASDDVDYNYSAETSALSIDANDSLVHIDALVDVSSDISVVTHHEADIEADDYIQLDVTIHNTFVSLDVDMSLDAGLYYTRHNQYSIDDASYDSGGYFLSNLGESVDDFGPSVNVSVDDFSDIQVIGRSHLNLGGFYSSDWVEIDGDISIDSVGLSIDSDAARIAVDLTNHSTFYVGAEVSDDIHPNDDGEFTTGGNPEFGNITLDYELNAHVISVDGDYSTIDINVFDNSQLVAYTSYESNLNEVDATRGLYTHHVDVREDSNIIAIDGSFSTITLDVSADSLVEAGSIISIDGWGNDIAITAYGSSDIIANDGDVVHIEYYATPDRSFDGDVREQFGNSIEITIDDSYLGANDDVIDVGAHSSDVDFTATNYAEVEADGSLIKLNGKHQDVSVNLNHEATVSISHDENMIEIIGSGADVHLDMSFGSEVRLDYYDNLDDRNVIDVQGRYADVHVHIGDSSADLDDVPRGLNLDSSQDMVDIYADDLIEIDGGNAHVQVSIENNSGSLEFTDDFIEIKGDAAEVDLSIHDSSNVCVDNDMVIIDGDFSSVDISVTNSDIEVGQLANIQGDAYELSVYIDDARIYADGDLIQINSEHSYDINAGYVSLEIYDSSLDIEDDLIDIVGDDNHATVLVHDGRLAFSSELFDIDGDGNTLLATFVGTSIDAHSGYDYQDNSAGYMLSIDGNDNNASITLSDIQQTWTPDFNYYPESGASLDVSITGDGNKVDLNINDASQISLSIDVDGDDNYVSIDLNDESYLNVDLSLYDESGDLDVAFNLERESEVDFNLNFGSSYDYGYGNIDLDLTLNDGSRVDGHVYLAESMDLTFTSNAHNHDHNSNIWFVLDHDSSMSVDHLDTNGNQHMDLRYTGNYNAYLRLEANDNYDRIDVENSNQFGVDNFTDEDTLLIDGDSFSWQGIGNEYWDGGNWYDEADYLWSVRDAGGDAVFLYHYYDSADVDHADRGDIEFYLDEGYESYFRDQDLYWVEINIQSGEVDIYEYERYDYYGGNLELAATLYDASGSFDYDELAGNVSTGYINNYVL